LHSGWRIGRIFSIKAFIIYESEFLKERGSKRDIYHIFLFHTNY